MAKLETMQTYVVVSSRRQQVRRLPRALSLRPRDPTTTTTTTTTMITTTTTTTTTITTTTTTTTTTATATTTTTELASGKRPGSGGTCCSGKHRSGLGPRWPWCLSLRGFDRGSGIAYFQVEGCSPGVPAGTNTQGSDGTCVWKQGRDREGLGGFYFVCDHGNNEQDVSSWR